MLHSHGVRSAFSPFFTLFSIDTFSDLQRFDFDWRDTHCLMNGYRAPYPYRYVFGIFKREYLSEGPDIQPSFTGSLGIDVPVLFSFQHRRSAFAQAAEAVVAAVLRLHKYGLPQVLHPVADLSFDAHIGHFPKSVIVRPGAVTVEGIAVGVGPIHTDEGCKVDFILQSCHFPSPPYRRDF